MIAAAYGPGLDYRPDTALVDHYDADARLGMHHGPINITMRVTGLD